MQVAVKIDYKKTFYLKEILESLIFIDILFEARLFGERNSMKKLLILVKSN